MGTVRELTDDTFATEVERAGVAVVDFWAPWCGPCLAIAPAVDELARAYEGRVTVAKVNVDDSAATAARFGVRSIPTLLFFRDGTVVDQVVGALPKGRLAERFERLAALAESGGVAAGAASGGPPGEAA